MTSSENRTREQVILDAIIRTAGGGEYDRAGQLIADNVFDSGSDAIDGLGSELLGRRVDNGKFIDEIERCMGIRIELRGPGRPIK